MVYKLLFGELDSIFSRVDVLLVILRERDIYLTPSIFEQYKLNISQ